MSERYQIKGRQIAAARTLLGMAQTELANAANVSVATLRRMEASEDQASGTKNNIAAVRYALEMAGIEFLDENGGGIGVRFRKT